LATQQRFTGRGYFALKITMAVFVVAYVVIAYAGGSTERRQYFPVFNWSLFSSVESRPSVVELHVKRIGDQSFNPPVNYFELGSYFATARSRSPELPKNAGLLAAAAERGDTKRVEQLRRMIELQDLSGQGTVEYQLVRVEFDPIERWKTGRNLREVILAEYQTGTRK
jgi:hypothetical protein